MPVIIGGGISGLYAALKLVDQGHTDIRLYEARERFGGNIFTHYDKDFQLEGGASRFNQYHKRLLKLLKRFQLNIYPIPKEKWFAPVLCPGKRMADPTYNLILEVIEFSKTLTIQELTQITFAQLCEQAIGTIKTDVLINSFGYNAEFTVANAYTSIQIFKEDFNLDTPYYMCQEGLSELINRMVAYLREKGVHLYTQWLVQDISEKEGKFVVKFFNHRSIKTDQLVLAIPSSYLQTFSLFNDLQKTLLNTVEPIPLHRIYAQENRPITTVRTTTDLPIRQYIPIYPDKGIAMVSYSDLDFADYWKRYTDQGIKKLSAQLLIQLKQLFPKDPPSKFNWVLSFYWKEGVHAWKTGVNPKQIRKQLKTLIPGLAIVGESYSMRQGWMEGALETVDTMLEPAVNGGASNSTQWVKLKVPGETTVRTIDVSSWMYQHPGGKEPYLRNMHKDVTHLFKNNPYHFTLDGKIKPYVMSMINKYTVK